MTTGKPLKILYLSHEGDFTGGSTFSLLNLIHSLKGEVSPIVIVPVDGKACEEFRARGIKYFIVPFRRAITAKKGLKRILYFVPRYFVDHLVNYIAVQKIKKIAEDENIDLIHSNSLAVGIGLRLATLLNIKHVWHIRELLNQGTRPFASRNIFLKKIYRSDAIICVTRCVYDHYILTGNTRAEVIYNGIRPRSEVNFVQQKKDYLLFCSVVTHGKGIEDALRAFAIIRKRYPHIRLIVAGMVLDAYRRHLNLLMDGLGITGAVDFLGFEKNIDRLMAEALCLLMCSKSEGLGRVTVEAMFNGCPVIGNAVWGTLEIIDHNETGFLYRTQDELIQRISYVIDHKEDVIPVIKKAQLFARESFAEEKYAKDIMKVYGRLVSKK